jgi:uncharacterized protein YbjT (DUF2867 family)
MHSGKKLSVILTGATGMVGEGVLHQCLQDADIDRVLVVGRRSCGVNHPKMKEVIHQDLLHPEPIREQVAGYDACFFCLGVSSVGMKEHDYAVVTHDLTLAFAGVLQKANPQMTFCYISGYATDSTEKGRSMWARVKGRTENDLLKLFPNAFMFRPGYMRPIPGMKHTLKYYKYVDWMYPLLRPLFPRFMGTLEELGRAMIAVAKTGYSSHILELKDIRVKAKQ